MLSLKFQIPMFSLLLLAACNNMIGVKKLPPKPTAHIKVELGPGVKELVRVGDLSGDYNIRMMATNIYGGDISLNVVHTFYGPGNVKLGEWEYGDIKLAAGETGRLLLGNGGIAHPKEIQRVVITRR